MILCFQCRGFIKFLCRKSVGFFSQAFLVFLMKESKKRRLKQPGKLMAKSRSQPVSLPGARPLMNPLQCEDLSKIFLVSKFETNRPNSKLILSVYTAKFFFWFWYFYNILKCIQNKKVNSDAFVP